MRTSRVLGSPVRNVVSILGFMVVIVALAIAAYMAAGWSFTDASYMVTLTVFTVGYGEVRPIDTPYLHAVTMGTMVLGCTGMILLTSALVQLFTLVQFRELFGANRMKERIDQLEGHVVVCGFGRIGVMLARDLAAAGTPLLVLERDADRIAQAEAAGYLVLAGDATDEDALIAAGIRRARTLATVLPDDAANVFITLSAKSLNPQAEIIARGEAPTTERKLRHAGADHVVLPTHIGAERIARLVIYPDSDTIGDEGETARMVEDLEKIGLTMERLTIAEGSAAVGLTVAEAEQRAGCGLFVVGLDRGHDHRPAMIRADMSERLAAGDRVQVVMRPDAAGALAMFRVREKVRVGRNVY